MDGCSAGMKVKERMSGRLCLGVDLGGDVGGLAGWRVVGVEGVEVELPADDAAGVGLPQSRDGFIDFDLFLHKSIEKYVQDLSNQDACLNSFSSNPISKQH
ncbi:unnamed protein product [Allacma fusca]|uniref:Uncharacterized protein n=1 Tax=Allacma fusca TaxID=39272 RepID=A0A8J2KHX1_9HEXA|nr:unnamed protein product [Allacma fusca]